MVRPLRAYAVHSQLINMMALCLASLALDRRPIWLCKESYGGSARTPVAPLVGGFWPNGPGMPLSLREQLTLRRTTMANATVVAILILTERRLP
jgi:hypothetical protein